MSQHQPGSIRCDFIRPCCPLSDDRPLFLKEYKRTNRTRATKIVRCFPHCCPEHRPRSYCGSSLHVKIQTAPNTDQELRVFGRFEEHESTPNDSEEVSSTGLHLGAHVRANDICSASTGESIWVKGEIDIELSGGDLLENSATQMVYALRGSTDGFNHWEYDWKSGTSQRQRLTQHHFRVYVFAERNDDEWVVVGMTTSPPFTFSVYRKAHHDGGQPSIHDSVVTSEQETARTLSRTASEEDEEEKSDGGESFHEVGSISQASPESAAVLRELVWHHQNRSVGKITTNLAILTLLTYEGEPSWLAMRSRSIFRVLRAATSSTISDHLLLNYVNHCAPQLIALLPQRKEDGETAAHSQPVASHTPFHRTLSHTSLRKWQTSMELLSDLLCFVLDPAQASPLLAFVSAHASLPSLTHERRRDLYVQTLEMFAEQVERFLQLHGQSTEGLVDDVASIILAKKTGPTYHRVLFLLRNVNVMGQSRFDALLHRLQDPVQTNSDDSTGHSPSSRWSGTWICRGFERAVSSEDSRRRRSWPDITRSAAASSTIGARSVGMMAAMDVILTAFGVTITRRPLSTHGDGGVHDTIGIYPIASPLGKSGGSFPLDYTFREAGGVLPLEWVAVLITSRDPKNVYCRARALGQERGDIGESQIEVEFLLCAPDREHSSVWRCVLLFELLPSRANGESSKTHPLVTPRRRMHIHVKLDEGDSTSVRAKERKGRDKGEHSSSDEETKSDANESSDGGSTTESENFEHRGHEGEDGKALQVYLGVQSWLERSKFKCIYYFVE